MLVYLNRSRCTGQGSVDFPGQRRPNAPITLTAVAPAPDCSGMHLIDSFPTWSTPGVLIRAQRPADAEALADVHLRSWRWAYAGLIADSYIDLLWSQRAERVERTRRMIAEAGPEERFWLAERGGVVVGLAMTSASRDPDAVPGTGEVGAIYLAPEAAGQGIGRALFTHAVDDLRGRGYRQSTLWVLDTNLRARRFYEAAGWQPDGATKVEERPGVMLHEVRYAVDFTGRLQEGQNVPELERPGALASIGNTPLVRLSRLPGPSDAEVWVKLEAANPTGSYKDRMGLAMIEGAERAGRLRPGQTVVEYTGGSTGSSLALVCALKGYPLRIVSSDAFAPEKIATMRAFGADVELIPSPAGITPDLIPRMMARVREIVTETGGYATDQFRNEDMIEGYLGLGRELAAQLDDRLDAICLYIGTAGCFLGTTRALRERLPDLRRVAIEPAESAVLSGGAPGTHHIEGGGIGFWPPQLTREDFDEVQTVSTEDAVAMARRAAREEGIFSGPSTGANLTVALRLATRLGQGARVATVQVDSGLKYLGGSTYR